MWSNPAGNRETIAYDPDGLRTEHQTTTPEHRKYVWDGQNVLVETDGADATLLFTAGANYIGDNAPANRLYALHVAQGRVEALTDATHQCRSAAWSPDGKSIVINSTQPRR